jgi:hypothetical protein
MDRLVLACGLVALLAVGGCGRSAEDEALALATEVCKTAQAGAQDGEGPEAWQGRLSAVADTAGKAARLDGTWSPLARAIADASRQAGELGAWWEGLPDNPNDASPQEMERGRKITREVMDTRNTIEAECRKTTP